MAVLQETRQEIEREKKEGVKMDELLRKLSGKNFNKLCY